MFIYPDFLTDFKCIGSDCLNTCCNGWSVGLDETAADYYERLGGEFGDFVRQNVFREPSTNKITGIKPGKGNYCPFLNEKGLCRIQIECGEEHLGSICQNYPRHEYGNDNISILGVVTSCDAVLAILDKRTQPVFLRTAGEKDLSLSEPDDNTILELAHFISWGMELLQDESIPFGAALSTVLYVAFEIQSPFEQQDFKRVDTILLQAPEILAQFIQTSETLDPLETEKAAWKFISGVIESFCQILPRTANAYKPEELIWNPDLMRQTSEERRRFLMTSWHALKSDKQRASFVRKFAATCFLHHALQFPVSEYLSNLCTAIILMEILPLTWKSPEQLDKRVYFSRLSLLSRWFEQSNSFNDHLQSVLKDSFSPNLFTYAIAFMVLFDLR